ncbi:MAG: hypothetical protein H6799_00325 [Candidatus Nomurabacteria bacterium]|nr:MAG: hypothetical protein H6799_00325 [Candidatus Nomurabacteria bacterium]HRV76378.1 hypothetical protein [Candidatus Saccharimonadales bacterium]
MASFFTKRFGGESHDLKTMRANHSAISALGRVSSGPILTIKVPRSAKKDGVVDAQHRFEAVREQKPPFEQISHVKPFVDADFYSNVRFIDTTQEGA